MIKKSLMILGLTLLSMPSFASDSSSKIINLQDGYVNYELSGPANGPLVVLVHGVSGPMAVWDKVVEPLRQSGFQVLRFDLYGRGASERINSNYDLNLYVNELTHLLQDLQLSSPIILVGSSMGAIISTAFTLKNPNRVRKIVLIGPGGFPLKTPPLAKLINTPYIGNSLVKYLGEKVILQQNRRYFYRPEYFSNFLANFKVQLEIPGSVAAIFSTTKNVPLQNFLTQYEELGSLGIPVQIIWGEQDVSFPFENHTKLLSVIPSADFVPVKEAAHLPQYEQPQTVSDNLMRFLKQ